MEPTTPIPQPNPQTLDDLIARLAKQPVVSGILLMGTTGTAAQAVERVSANPASWPDGSEESTLVNWLRDGRIAHDREQQLAAAQERFRRAPPPATGTESEVDEARQKITYNMAQLKRYFAAEDAVSQIVVDLRLPYSLFEVAYHYFTIRHLPWRGEKAAVRYWTEHDQGFLDVLRQCLGAPDRRHKTALYEELAQRALAPVGGLWESGATITATGAGWGAGAEGAPSHTQADALSFWQQLITDDVI